MIILMMNKKQQQLNLSESIKEEKHSCFYTNCQYLPGHRMWVMNKRANLNVASGILLMFFEDPYVK